MEDKISIKNKTIEWMNENDFFLFYEIFTFIL